MGQSPAERRLLFVQKLTAGKWLHHGNPDAFLFTASVYGAAFIHAAVGVFPLTVVISGVDREHQHIHARVVQDALNDGRRVGRKPDMTHDAVLLKLSDIVVNAVLPIGLPIGKLVLAVDKAVVDIIRPKRPELIVYGALDRIEVKRPAIGSL